MRWEVGAWCGMSKWPMQKNGWLGGWLVVHYYFRTYSLGTRVERAPSDDEDLTISQTASWRLPRARLDLLELGGGWWLVVGCYILSHGATEWERPNGNLLRKGGMARMKYMTSRCSIHTLFVID